MGHREGSAIQATIAMADREAPVLATVETTLQHCAGRMISECPIRTRMQSAQPPRARGGPSTMQTDASRPVCVYVVSPVAALAVESRHAASAGTVAACNHVVRTHHTVTHGCQLCDHAAAREGDERLGRLQQTRRRQDTSVDW
eukprot:m.36652 g.36652  ORF g.36652 m.36652 type:complete len:143 (-) comp5429_c0_seq1:73-501(-)